MIVKYSDGTTWLPIDTVSEEEVIISNTAPSNTTKLWLDTSVSGIIPAEYAVADNCTTGAGGVAVLDAHQGYLLQNQINNLSEDFIVEQGTDGIWTYRKWNSGIAECWGTYDAMQVSISTSWGNGYYGAKQSNNTFPTGLFAHWPTLLVSNLTGDGVWFSVVDLTKDSFGYYPFCVNSGTRSLRIMAHAIGTWK